MDKTTDKLLSKISLRPYGTRKWASLSAKPHRLDVLIDRIIPRGGGTPNPICVTLEEYLARVASLYRKLAGCRYRLERWREVLSEHESRFAEVANSGTTDSPKDADSLPPGAKTSVTVSLQDAKLESEFEALLFSMRSALDHLARVVASYSVGHRDVHKYSGLRDMFGPGDKISSLVSGALAKWADDLVNRRDEITHYVAAVVISGHRKEVAGSQRLESHVLAGVRRVSNRRSVPVWYSVLPTIGGTQQTSSSVSVAGVMAEKYAIWDASGELIIEHVGPLPDPLSVIDGGELVEDLYRAFESHLGEILSELRDRWEH